jgi:hypothetical protein
MLFTKYLERTCEHNEYKEVNGPHSSQMKRKKEEKGKLEVSGCETVINFTCGYLLAVWTSTRVTIRTLMCIYGKAQHDDMGYQSILTLDFMR